MYHLSILYHTLSQSHLLLELNTSAMEVPDEQWAQVIPSPNSQPEYKQIPVSSPGPDEVLVHVLYTGVCHTDLHAVDGDWPIKPKLPLVGGHEGAGEVVKVGELVGDLKVGDRVGIKVRLLCSCIAYSPPPLSVKDGLRSSDHPYSG